jgi:hypothetical protein
MNLNFNFRRKVFISHADEDSDIAHNIAFLIKKTLNVDVALDKYFLYAGDDWKAKIKHELRSSEIVIVLESRIVAASLAKGVVEEIEMAEKYNIPVFFGLIRRQIHELKGKNYQVIDFGKDGKNEEAVNEIARILIGKTHPFMNIGLAALVLNKHDASQVHGNTNEISKNAKEVYVIGHTLKSWLHDYGNLIRYGNAKIKIYFPSKKDISLKHLSLIHKNGDKILPEIANAKKRAIELNFEPGFDKDKLECYVLKIKPMFSIMGVDLSEPHGFITVDNYLVKISSDERPKMIIYKAESPLFELFKGMLFELIKDAEQLTSPNQ